MWLHTDGIEVPSRAASSAIADAGVVLDQTEDGQLPGGHTRGVHLAAQMAVEMDQHRPEPVGDVDGSGGQQRSLKFII